jgi:hypothetical protein
VGQGGGLWDIKGLRGRVKGVLGGWGKGRLYLGMSYQRLISYMPIAFKSSVSSAHAFSARLT